MRDDGRVGDATPGTATRRAGLGTLGRLLRPHRTALAGAGVLALANAGASLAQPLLVRRVIADIQQSRPVVAVAVLLVAALVLAAVLSGIQS
jgi:ABC-type multidrug transport system fused ATPase/permease subunit